MLFRSVPKHHARVRAIGGIDEANAAIGVALLYVSDPEVRGVLSRAQNDLFDLGADVCRPENADSGKQPLRMTAAQVANAEAGIDRFNAGLLPLTSFVLPGGTKASAYLHLARTQIRRAERDMTELADSETLNPEALKYINRLSDLLFVLARYENGRGQADVLWTPGANR